MQCQTEGCNGEALYAVQVMSAKGYRVGVCRECAIRELKAIGQFKNTLDLLNNTPYCFIITNADWWREPFYEDLSATQVKQGRHGR